MTPSKSASASWAKQGTVITSQNSYDDARVKQELSAIGKSYEAMASLVVDGELERRQLHDGSQASPQQMQRLSGSASRV
jgi:hypothetical protein